MTDLSQVKLIDLIPPNLRDDPQVMAAAEALDQELRAVNTEIEKTIIMPRIGEQPEDVVDLLAWEHHVDFYDSDLPIEKKRILVSEAYDWHRRLGTPSVVEEVVSAVFDGGKVLEWFEYDGIPGKFRVETTDTIYDGTVFDKLIRLINTVKNTRSHLESIRVTRQTSRTQYLGVALQIGNKITVKPAAINVHDFNLINNLGIARREASFITIKPEVS